MLTLSELEGIHLLPSRGSGLHDEHADDVGHAHHDYHHVHGPVDPHLWLAENGIIIANQIAETLAERDQIGESLPRKCPEDDKEASSSGITGSAEVVALPGYSFSSFDAYQFEEAFGPIRRFDYAGWGATAWPGGSGRSGTGSASKGHHASLQSRSSSLGFYTCL